MTRSKAQSLPALGRVVAAARASQSLSLRDVERMSGVTHTTVADIEHGTSPYLTLANAVRLARSLSLTPEQIFTAASDDLRSRGDQTGPHPSVPPT